MTDLEKILEILWLAKIPCKQKISFNIKNEPCDYIELQNEITIHFQNKTGMLDFISNDKADCFHE